MESGSSPANSRVTIECLDPDNLFQIFETLLKDNLPLRNLYWKSPNRPLRSIDSLHVALTKAEDGRSENGGAARRHQIPGLRETPYVKIYLLRCDDKESYKESARKKVREWLKANSSSSEGKRKATGSEGYDASEWLVVHIVLPNTPAALQPRTSKHDSVGPADSTDSVSTTGKSKWPGKGSSTLYEKLRADFNSSSKNTIDHIAQIRTGQKETGPGSEHAEQWIDLVDKLKSAVLSSFDKRVEQYEEDIREKDSQRNLPGWNFCTFFVLKEGLAKGFESGGLLDDALAGYDELEHGLDTIIREQAATDGDAYSGTFLPFSWDVKAKAAGALASLETSIELPLDAIVQQALNGFQDFDRSQWPLDSSNKPYRDLILSNKISIFDFRVYICSRQLEVLLQKAKISRREKTTNKRDSQNADDLLILSEVCKRAAEFINLGARTLRADVLAGLQGEKVESEARLVSTVDDVVNSWMFCAALQILKQTRFSAEAESSDKVESRMATANGSLKEPVQKQIPSSTPEAATEVMFLAPAESSEGPRQSSDFFNSKEQLHQTQDSNKITLRTGLEELTTQRAELYLMCRKVLERVVKNSHWVDFGAAPMTNGDSAVPQEIDTDPTQVSRNRSALEPKVLEYAAQSKSFCFQLYETLTDLAFKQYSGARKLHFAQRLLTDVAMLNYHNGDIVSAVAFFEQVVAFYGAALWTTLQERILEEYADCLFQLDRKEQYLRARLELFNQYVARSSKQTTATAQNQLQHIIDYASQHNQGVETNMDNLFELVSIDPRIHPIPVSDGFKLFISIRCKLKMEITVTNLELLLLSSDDSLSPELRLQTFANDLVIGFAESNIALFCNGSVTGLYKFHALSFDIGHIHFRLNNEDLSRRSFLNRAIQVYPALGSMQIDASPAAQLYLSQSRSLVVKLRSGYRDISSAHLFLKSATAGLRLNVHQATALSPGAPELPVRNTDAGRHYLFVDSLPSRGTLSLAIPYSLESLETYSLCVKVELQYNTEAGAFCYYDTITINTILPISVNVQDIFKLRTLASRFTISPATLVPLRITSCSATSTQVYKATSALPATNNLDWDVFAKQAASIIFKLSRNSSFPTTDPDANKLALVVETTLIDDIILRVLQAEFTTAVLTGPLAYLARLLTPHLLSTYKANWTEQDLEVMALTREVTVWPYSELYWEPLIGGLSKTSQGMVREWLQAWHIQNLTIPFPASESSLMHELKRTISIPVEVPQPRFVVAVNIRIPQLDHNVAILGLSIMADLVIEWTTRWAAPPKSPEEKFELTYEVLAQGETWLVAGRKRSTISLPRISSETSTVTTEVANGETETRKIFPILLLPQRIGTHLLPAVQITVRALHKPSQQGQIPQDETVHIALDHMSAAKTVKVVSGLRETVVGIDIGGQEQNELAGLEGPRTWVVGGR